MQPIADRTVIENVALARCAKGDEIDVSHGRGSTRVSVGPGVIRSIKPLPRGGHQIKLLERHTGAVVRKVDLPAGVVVERRRTPTAAEIAADPSLAPREPVATTARDGLRYQATDPSVDLEKALDDASGIVAIMPERLTDRHLVAGMDAFGLVAASLGLASLAAGARIVRAED